MKKHLLKKIVNMRYNKKVFKFFHFLIIHILTIHINICSLTTIIKYKGIKNQQLTNCGNNDSCNPAPSYNSYYNIKLKDQTEYINNQLVNIAEIQWRYSLSSFKCMFSQCINIISINLNNFDTSSCTEMTAMFRGCTSLVSIELNNFVISRATLIGQMFRGCSSLISLDLSSFRGTNVQHMDNMFNGCSSLVHINLENFNYENVIGMGALFEGCISLLSLNLPNFNTQSALYMDKLFYNCKNLQYINMPNVKTNSADIADMFYGMPPNFVICYPDYGATKIDNLIRSNQCRIKYCSGNWKDVQKNIIQIVIDVLMIVDHIIYMNMNMNLNVTNLVLQEH